MESEYDPSAYWSEVLKAARVVAKAYMRWEPEDIAQAIMVDMCESPKRYKSIGGKLFFEALKRAGYRYCQDQASRLLATDDEYTYSGEEIKTLLHRYYDPSTWPNGWTQPLYDGGDVGEYSRELELWSENTRIHIDHFDLELAIKKLRPAHRKAIEKRYRDKEELSRYEAKNCSHAIRLVTFYVNENAYRTYRNIPWDYEGPGARQAMTNAGAIRLTSYEGGFDGVRRSGYARA
ncbi:hypothetical protein [Nonomuraea sp. NPDC049141]|uniref:hypothetical protein n=1 Tax=Nonomuraea sp. NPDC049141 TaxID=3155500 RepID=UPI0033FE88E3